MIFCALVETVLLAGIGVAVKRNAVAFLQVLLTVLQRRMAEGAQAVWQSMQGDSAKIGDKGLVMKINWHVLGSRRRKIV